MGKKKQQFMDLNRETAMRLWNKSFGKDTKAVDFAGRTIAKGAYNDRNSEYGWNVDHILPQSKGGVTADYNLICCHIKTNDEKADKFPCFTANETTFEIVKVQNHYEITAKNDVKVDELTNFFDSASGVRLFETIKNIQSKERFVGSVFVKIQGLKNSAVIDFVDCLFEKEYVWVDSGHPFSDDITVSIRNNYMPLKDDTSELLDKCVLLNTYFADFFLPHKYVESFEIYFRLDCFNNDFSMYRKLDGINSHDIDFRIAMRSRRRLGPRYDNTLLVNGNVLENTEAGQKVKRQDNSEYTEYNFVFTKLSENLKKEASGK